MSSISGQEVYVCPNCNTPGSWRKGLQRLHSGTFKLECCCGKTYHIKAVKKIWVYV